MGEALTPSMQQYLKAKAEHPDCILLFRMGDFYETFYEDAVEASRILDIALTSRNRDDPNPIPMAGVPWHSVDQYIARLVEAGKKVAICEQMEDPKQAKGLVRREVVRIVTPGVLLDTEMPDPSQVHHLVSIANDQRGIGIAALDTSTGRFQAAYVTDMDQARAALHRLSPKEVLYPDGLSSPLLDQLQSQGALLTPIKKAENLEPTNEYSSLISEKLPPTARLSALFILSYLQKTWPALMRTVRPLEPLPLAGVMFLPQSAQRNLELVRTISGRPKGSLYHHLNRTRTPMGSRLLMSWLLAPLLDIEKIEERLDAVEAFVRDVPLRGAIRQSLKGIADLERLLSRFAGGAASARDLNALARGIRALEACEAHLSKGGEKVKALLRLPETLLILASEIERTFVEDPPATTREGGMVRRGAISELDRVLDLLENGRRYLAEYEAAERARTGIPTLKVRYNRVFGYSIEVSRSFLHKVPQNYQRRQTLTNAERFVTEDLLRLEEQIASAEERSKAIEAQVFEEFREKVLSLRAEIQSLAEAAALLDVYTTLAEVAHSDGYSRPKVTTGRQIAIRGGRHPVVEASLPPNTFIPNDYVIDGERTVIDIITGPNMAGKSTVMRQVALIVLMAQMGSFVPAEEAEVGLVDALFTRVGAMDDLALGRSTFMVEMVEVAEILSKATERSLVILDEVGRGTSTFDGVAIAWAVVEYIHNRIGCRTLFATHYHELTDLARVLPRVRNLSVQVKEWGGQVLFLRKLVEGPANKSYGIQVARLAGLPEEVLLRAREVLSNLEAHELDAVGTPNLAKSKRGQRSQKVAQLELFAAEDPLLDSCRRLAEEVASLDTDRLTPLEALQVLARLSSEAKNLVR